MLDDTAMQASRRRLADDDAIGQLRRRDGLMATLGSEDDGALKLDWVEAVARLLADPAALESVEGEARDIRARGIRHIIWAGMGGSVLTVRVLCALGFGGTAGETGNTVVIHPLDSTDPAALNAIVRAIAAAKGIVLSEAAASQAALHDLLRDVLMIGVSMGMTSEEPITHLSWFTELLEQADLPPADHLLVMTLPDSYLDAFARQHSAPSRPLQLDGGAGTGGRMSAPGTRVFLLPAALYLTGLSDEAGQLRAVLQAAWDAYDLDLATTHPEQHPYVRLAAALSAASSDGACRLLVRLPEGWQVLVSWLEQLMEESLGKGGKGIVVFDDQPLNVTAPGYRAQGTLRVREVAGAPEDAEIAQGDADEPLFLLSPPTLEHADPRHRLAAVAARFLSWQLSMALYGYLHHIQFAGQPAVENYKARARALRAADDPLQVVAQRQPFSRDGVLTLLAPAGAISGGATMPPPDVAFADALRAAVANEPARMALGYLDVTVNGEAPTHLLTMLEERVRAIGNALLGVPVKLRRAPAAYHSTEQSEMDGPPSLVSLRLVARESAPCLLGSYTSTFLHAQAVSTWQAMTEIGRACFLLVIDGSLDEAAEPLTRFLAHVVRALTSGSSLP